MAAVSIKTYFYVVLVLTMLTSVPVFASNSAVCGVCSKTEEVALMVRSEDFSHDDQFSAAHERTQMEDYSKATESLKTVLPFQRFVVSNPMELRQIILKFAQKCKRIRYFSFLGHGRTGTIYFDGVPDGVINHKQQLLTSENAAEHLSGLSCAFAPNAYLNLRSCLVGRSCKGQAFMKTLASHLLQNGGTVRAATLPELFLAYGLTPWVPIGPVKYLTVSPGLKAFSWRNGNQACEK
jgi:hypothetical protein